MAITGAHIVIFTSEFLPSHDENGQVGSWRGSNAVSPGVWLDDGYNYRISGAGRRVCVQC